MLFRSRTVRAVVVGDENLIGRAGLVQQRFQRSFQKRRLVEGRNANRKRQRRHAGSVARTQMQQTAWFSGKTLVRFHSPWFIQSFTKARNFGRSSDSDLSACFRKIVAQHVYVVKFFQLPAEKRLIVPHRRACRRDGASADLYVLSAKQTVPRSYQRCQLHVFKPL